MTGDGPRALRKVDPRLGVLRTGQLLQREVQGHRRPPGSFFRDQPGPDLYVDTAVAGDTEMWETAILRDGRAVIVEQYEDREPARSGHARWVASMKADPGQKLTDLDLWGLDGD